MSLMLLGGHISQVMMRHVYPVCKQNAGTERRSMYQEA